MPNITTLKLNKEFRRAYYQGKYKAHPLLVTYRVKNRNRMPRVGITASKKIGCAVKRNRARRIIRQAFRELFAADERLRAVCCDYVFVARAATVEATTAQVRAVMKKQLSLLEKL